MFRARGRSIPASAPDPRTASATCSNARSAVRSCCWSPQPPANLSCTARSAMDAARAWTSRTPRPAAALDVVVPEVAVVADLPVPGTPEEREQVAAQLVAGLVKDPPGDALADAYAKKVVDLAREWLEQVAPTHPSSLAAVATGLEEVSDTVKTGVVWCATELLGMPDSLGKVLAHVVSDLVTDPLHLKDVCRAIRAVDTAVCTLNGDLGSCASARYLAFTEVGQTVLADQLKEAIREPHNDDMQKKHLTETVKDLHENEVLEQLKAALAKAVEDHVAGPCCQRRSIRPGDGRSTSNGIARQKPDAISAGTGDRRQRRQHDQHTNPTPRVTVKPGRDVDTGPVPGHRANGQLGRLSHRSPEATGHRAGPRDRLTSRHHLRGDVQRRQPWPQRLSARNRPHEARRGRPGNQARRRRHVTRRRLFTTEEARSPIGQLRGRVRFDC